MSPTNEPSQQLRKRARPAVVCACAYHTIVSGLVDFGRHAWRCCLAVLPGGAACGGVAGGAACGGVAGGAAACGGAASGAAGDPMPVLLPVVLSRDACRPVGLKACEHV